MGIGDRFFIVKRAREPQQAFDRLVEEADAVVETAPSSPMEGRRDFTVLPPATVRELNQMFDAQVDDLQRQIRESDSVDERRELRAQKRELIEAKKNLRAADKSTSERKAVAMANARLDLARIQPDEVGCIRVKQGWWLFFGWEVEFVETPEEVEDAPTDTEAERIEE